MDCEQIGGSRHENGENLMVKIDIELSSGELELIKEARSKTNETQTQFLRRAVTLALSHSQHFESRDALGDREHH